jgi:hypothetical protein
MNDASFNPALSFGKVKVAMAGDPRRLRRTLVKRR